MGSSVFFFFFFQAEDGIRDGRVTGVQTCALPISLVAMPLPLFLLALPLAWPAAVLVVGAFAFFTPLVNAPIIGVLTVRAPEALRAKVMTSVLTVATIAGPLGFLAAGQALRYVSLSLFFLVLSALLTFGSWAFSAVLLRQTAADRTQERRTEMRPDATVE